MNSFLSFILKAIGQNVPGVGISAAVYYNGKKAQFLTKAKQKGISIEDYLKEQLESQLANINSLSDYDLVSLATDLCIFFKADRSFKKGWVVDAYFKVYDKLSSNDEARLALDFVSGW